MYYLWLMFPNFYGHFVSFLSKTVSYSLFLRYFVKHARSFNNLLRLPGFVCIGNFATGKESRLNLL